MSDWSPIDAHEFVPDCDCRKCLLQRLAAAEAELEQYRTKRLLCWDEADPEHRAYDEQEIAEYFADNMADDESFPFSVMRALSLPDREMIVTLSGGKERKMTWEWVDVARPGLSDVLRG